MSGKRKRAQERTIGEYRELAQMAVHAHLGPRGDRQWVYIRDVDADEGWVVYELEGEGWPKTGTFKAAFTVTDDGASVGDGEQVLVTTDYEPVIIGEATKVRHTARVLEAKTPTANGGRVFRCRMIEAGKSRNGRIYPQAVLEAAAAMYEGAKAFDHHRTADELETSTVGGIVGYWRNVEATAAGLDGDLHILPSATHAAELLDATLAVESDGMEPVVGISHDVMAKFRTTEAGPEATQILSVLSTDIVAHPSAGGKAIRAVAGGTPTGNETPESKEKAVTIEELLALLSGATPEQRAAALEGLGISAEDLTKLAGNPTDPPAEEAIEEETTELVAAESFTRGSTLGNLAVRTAVTDAGLDVRLSEAITQDLPERFSEADLKNRVAVVQRVTAGLEKTGLAPRSNGDTKVTKDEHDKLSGRIDATLAGNYREGFRSFRQMYAAFHPNEKVDVIDGDFPAMFMREARHAGHVEGAARSSEAITTASFAETLGDSITRRMIAVYSTPGLQSWRRVVSSMPPVNDFRTQRRDRIGGYGVLPTVAQSGPYTALTTPGDEEATYAITKKGGKETLTLEAVANDDLGALQSIPLKLGRAAAQTLYRFVWDLIITNPTCTYDSVALFHASHANTSTTALSNAALTAARTAMRKQTAYGDSSEVLGITPRLLIVPPELEQLAFELAGRVKVTTGEDATLANLHDGMEPLVLDHLTDANNWFVAGDPAATPTIEVGFYQGMEEPELFLQSDPTVGSNFDTDAVTWKIRHIYSGAILDHRAFYGGIVA